MKIVKIDLVLPVLNEEVQLEHSIHRLLSPGISGWSSEVRIIIADNGSTDRTSEIGMRMARECSGVEYLRIEERGRGRALKIAWSKSNSPILAYMDIDLSTDLRTFPRLLVPLILGKAEISVGCRLHPEARVVRCWTREMISRAYNQLARSLIGTQIRDLQCGFKAISRQAVQALVPMVEDNGWFFDTELLLLAEALNYRIHQEPVTWVEDSESRVRLLNTAWTDWKGLLRMRRTLSERRLYDRLHREAHVAA